MPVLLRLVALGSLLVLSRLRKTGSPEMGRRIEALSWARRAQFVWALATDRQVPLLGRAIVLLPALYLISPIDLLPDFLPVLGRLDDAAIFSLSIDLLQRFAPLHVIETHLYSVDPPRRRTDRRDQQGAPMEDTHA